MIIAHRGISFDLPENSLPAFNASWDKGVDGIEGDFHLPRMVPLFVFMMMILKEFVIKS